MVTRKNTVVMELWIGAGFIIGVLLVAAMILFMGRDFVMFQKTYVVTASMPSIGALKKGAPIQLAGLDIGRVDSIDLNADASAVDIVCLINWDIPLPEDSKARIATTGIIGDSFLEIVRGQSHVYLRKQETFGPDAGRISGAGASGLEDIMRTATGVGEDVSELIQNLNTLMGDPEVVKSLRTSLLALDGISRNFGLLLADSREILGRVNSAIDPVQEATAALPETFEEVRNTIRKISASADRLLGPENIALVEGTLYDVKQASAKLNSSIERIDTLLAAIPPNQIASLLDQADHLMAKGTNFADEGAALLASVDKQAINKAVIDLGTALEAISRIISEIDPADVAAAVGSAKTALADVQGFLDAVKRDLPLALSINKAADRIIDKKFKEMGRDPRYQTADEQMEEITRWINQTLHRGGLLSDPAYPDPAKAPYRSNLP